MADGEVKAVSLLFRIASLSLSVAAAVVMGTASEVVIVAAGGGRPSSYSVSYSQYNALTYFVAAGAISAVCSAVALYLFAVRAAATAAIGSLPLVPLLDAAAQAFLFSAAGAAFAARGAVGSAAGPWGSGGGRGAGLCDAAAAFCGRVSVAAAICASAAVAVAVASLAKDARRGSGGRCCDW